MPTQATDTIVTLRPEIHRIFIAILNRCRALSASADVPDKLLCIAVVSSLSDKVKSGDIAMMGASEIEAMDASQQEEFNSICTDLENRMISLAEENEMQYKILYNMILDVVQDYVEDNIIPYFNWNDFLEKQLSVKIASPTVFYSLMAMCDSNRITWDDGKKASFADFSSMAGEDGEVYIMYGVHADRTISYTTDVDVCKNASPYIAKVNYIPSAASTPVDKKTETANTDDTQDVKTPVVGKKENPLKYIIVFVIVFVLGYSVKTGKISFSKIPAVTPQAVVSVTATSHLEEPEYWLIYSPENVFDGQLDTAWSEAVSGPGIGEALTVTLDDTYLVSGFSINAGYQQDEHLYDVNSRPSELTVTFADGSSIDVALEDIYGQQQIEFAEPVKTQSVIFTIKAVYRGRWYQDTSISELQLY
ncbi:MAG: hypothetical protein IJN77_07525 [Oscillospiraceae bacterium]|nr:hypothetical protein [Oscillospiraceae bacterium]MBQ6850870.1 hypothetical protein [Oscillospiraceae bacterium]